MHARVPDQNGEWVIEFMGHSGEQLTHRRQLFPLPQALLSLLSFLGEPAVLQDDGGLIGESRKERDIIGGEPPTLLRVYIQNAGGLAVRPQGDPQKPVQADRLDGLLMERI